VAFCMGEGKRTQALRGRNQPGILSPKRRSDVRGQRDSADFPPDTLACFLQLLVTVENRQRVLPSGLAVQKTATPGLVAYKNSAALHFDASLCLKKIPGSGAAPRCATGVIRVRDAQGAKQSAGPSVQRSQQLPGPQGQRPNPNHLNRDAFHDIPGHSSLSTVIKSCRARISMSSEVLHISQWDSLFQEVRDRGHTQRVGR
jgi:hypothetical protein